MQVKKGSTDRTVELFFADSTTGLPKTGLAYNSSGIDLWYRRPGAAKTSLTEATLSALTDAHSDGGFLEIANGWYRLDLPDAAVVTGVPHVLIGGTVTGAVCYGVTIELVDFDPQDTVRLGLTALPNAAAEAAGGLYTRGTGAGQINQAANGLVDANVVQLSGDATAADNAESFFDGTGYAGTNNTIPAVTTVNGLAAGVITTTSIAADAFTAAKFASDVTTELQTGLATASALSTVSGKIDTIDDFLDTEIAAILADTNELQTDWANGGRLDNLLDGVATASALTTVSGKIDTIDDFLDTEVVAILADTNELQTDWANGGRLDNLLDGRATPADVNVQVLDVLNTDTFAEPSGVPGATNTLVNKLSWLYMALRNKVTVSSTKKTFFDDSDSAEWEKDLSDDGTTYTESEANSI